MSTYVSREVVGLSPEQESRCAEIADLVVPAYRDGKRSYSCGGHVAQRWGAAYEGAVLALGGRMEDVERTHGEVY